MDGYGAIGIVLGLVGALPPALLFERALRKGHVGVAAGLASIMASFMALTLSMLAVWWFARRHLLLFGCSEVGSFLLVWCIEAWRAWRDANVAVRTGERNSGESTR